MTQLTNVNSSSSKNPFPIPQAHSTVVVSTFIFQSRAYPMGMDLADKGAYLVPNSGLKVDDMIFTPEYLTTAKSGLINTNSRWPNKTLVYSLDSNFTSAEKAIIVKAITEIQQKTCIRFKVRDLEKSYVRVARGAANTGCNSYVGRVPANYQPQRLNLQYNGCIHHGIVAHEFIHALGFEHEHSRTDRDNYITVHLENVQKGYEFAFTKYSSSHITSFGIPYDYGSLMHYGAHGFSSNGQPTIVPKQNVKIGQRVGLSVNDALKVNKMYGC